MTSLHTPYFFIREKDSDAFRVCHNCNGSIDFMATDDITEPTHRLINLAIEEGKRQKALEIARALGVAQ